MRVAELWRYPVKALQGERLGSAPLSPPAAARVIAPTPSDWDRRRFRSNLRLERDGETPSSASR